MKPDDRTGAKLEAFYRDIDQRAKALARIHADRLQCRGGCCQCCVDGLTVGQGEAAHILAHCGEVLTNQKPHPPGRCAFLDQEGWCRIYAHRPYVCRTQGLPLRWHEEKDGTWIEYRDICPLNEEGPALEDLPTDRCWTIGPAEQRLAMLQRQQRAKAPGRIRLRDLFAKPWQV